MNKFVMMVVALVVTLFTVNALAFEPPAAPSDGTYVVDTSGKLTDAQKRRLNQKIEQVNRATKNEFGILLLSNMGGDTIEDVAYNTYKKWGVGKRGLDNGCLIVVSIKERKSRIETGKGVGGDVPDITAKKILDENLAPHLRKGDFYGGFDATLDALSTHIESRHAQKADPKPVATQAPTATHQRTNSGGCSVGTAIGAVGVGFGLIFLMGLIVVVAAVRYANRKAEERRQEELARAQRQAERQRRVQADLERKEREAARAREEQEARVAESLKHKLDSLRVMAASIPTPVVPTSRPTVPRPTPRVTTSQISTAPKTVPETPRAKAPAADPAVALATATALAESMKREREEMERLAARERAEREQEKREAKARRKREREEQEERERQEAELAAAAAAVSVAASAFGWGSSDDSSSSSSYSSDDSSSGFGGGDSGGGGASSDWGSSDDSSSDSSWDSGSSDDSSGSSSDW